MNGRLAMKSAIFRGTVVVLMTINGMAANGQIYGTWRLVSDTRTISATGQTEDTFGKAPKGYITYGRDGRMMVIILADTRPKPASLESITDQQRAQLFTTMISYAGTYTFDGKTVTHHIEISWNEVWSGIDLPRTVKFDGNKLILITKPQANPLDGKIGISTLTWEKVK